MITGTKAIKLLKNQLTNCLQFIVTHSTPHDLSLKNKIIKIKNLNDNDKLCKECMQKSFKKSKKNSLLSSPVKII